MTLRIARILYAFSTDQGVPQMTCPSLDTDYPGVQLPGWPVSYMLSVAAGQVCHPVVVLVLMKANNGSFKCHSC